MERVFSREGQARSGSVHWHLRLSAGVSAARLLPANGSLSSHPDEPPSTLSPSLLLPHLAEDENLVAVGQQAVEQALQQRHLAAVAHLQPARGGEGCQSVELPVARERRHAGTVAGQVPVRCS